LSRIRASNGDFCSREHHNQYRLRSSMDRMLEVNKVASLMRRCENPKPLALPARLGFAGIPQRGFFQPLVMEWRASQRTDGALRHPALRLTVAGSAFGIQPLEWPDNRLGQPARRARALVVAAQAGRALRVSGSAGFRIAKPAAPPAGSGERLPRPELKPPGIKIEPTSFLPAAPASAAPRACVLGLPRPEIRFPSAPAGPGSAARRFSGRRWLGFAPTPAGFQTFPRPAEVRFTASVDGPPSMGAAGSKEQ
jgi:hypothetical protein